MPSPNNEPSNNAEQQQVRALCALEALYEARDTLEFSQIDVRASDETYLPNLCNIFGGEDSDDDFYEERFLAAFLVENDGLSFHFRFGVVHQEPDECDPLPFGALVIQVFDLTAQTYLADVGFSSDFSKTYHLWRDYLLARYDMEI